MDYIVFDLEWNQCPDGKEREVPALPFEIIEIGAVKLNSERKMVDKFHCLVRPVVYPKLHFRTREIVKKTEEELRQGMAFPVFELGWKRGSVLYLGCRGSDRAAAEYEVLWNSFNDERTAAFL